MFCCIAAAAATVIVVMLPPATPRKQDSCGALHMSDPQQLPTPAPFIASHCSAEARKDTCTGAAKHEASNLM